MPAGRQIRYLYVFGFSSKSLGSLLSHALTTSRAQSLQSRYYMDDPIRAMKVLAAPGLYAPAACQVQVVELKEPDGPGLSSVGV